MNSEKISHVTDATFRTEVLSSKKPVLVYCCEQNSTSSIIYEIAEEYEERLKVVQMNIDISKRTADKYYIYNKPSFVMFMNGIIINTRLVQDVPKHRIIAFIDENILMPEEKLALLKKKQQQEQERKKRQEQEEIERRKREEQEEIEQRKREEQEEIEQRKEQELQLAAWYEQQRKWDEEIEMLKAIENKGLLTGYPFSCSKKLDSEYNPETKVLIVEYLLPNKESVPTLKELKYIKRDNRFREIHITETQRNKLFDSLMYQLTLRLISDLFRADAEDKISSIIFNGWVHSINRATGKHEDVCILSIAAKKEQFLEIDLSNVDPKACFKYLKGVGCTVLSSITPVQPILQINKADKRIVEGHDVIQDLEDATNLAAMHWQDFEYLVRELFEKEFMQNGGEVKVTQASRDGGVDAIAFDPDPIRGGKIIIQAKRYTNIVGVSSVRDLYGTVINEGATKGILITTADYGSDAYDFAKDKPITLLNGGHLLFMLQKHGQRAKIDLKEAKRIISEKEKAELEGKTFNDAMGRTKFRKFI